jgi:hypothetical protein
MGLFSNYTENLIEKVDTTYVAINPVDAIEFVTSSQYLCENPTPFQSIALKTLYGLWPYYPPNEDEIRVLKVLKEKWRLELDLNRDNETDPVLYFIMSLGRRATKSTLASFFATYAMYTLICRGDPQQYYGIRERHPIYITHVAAKEKQAQAVFTLSSDNIRKVTFFRPYIDFDKNNSTELRLYSPHDVWLNDQIRMRNLNLPKGLQKEATRPGSLNIKSITTTASTNRGDATFMLMLSEFAHFERAKTDPTKSLDQIAEENPTSDYAIYKALAPSVKDFKKDGKIILESSPMEKGGEFYRHYCIGGGYEQEPIKDENGIISPPSQEKGYAVLQLATWEARPTLPREEFDIDFRTDPRGANMEYGAHFGNPSGNFISEEVILRIPQPGLVILRRNPNIVKFVITVDPGGKAKKKIADAYAVSWGHYELGKNEYENTYWIDGMHGFLAENKDLGGGMYEQVEVDPNMVLSFILRLIKDLGGKSYIQEIAYDQWQNQSAISTLQHLGIPAIETTFTNPYKAEMYGDFLAKALLGQVKMYGVDEGGFINMWQLEMKYLQQVISGNKVFYHHPSSGPVQHDDFADVTANLVHRLIRLAYPKREDIQKNKTKKGRQMLVNPRTIKPQAGGRFWGGNNNIKYR